MAMKMVPINKKPFRNFPESASNDGNLRTDKAPPLAVEKIRKMRREKKGEGNVAAINIESRVVSSLHGEKKYYRERRKKKMAA